MTDDDVRALIDDRGLRRGVPAVEFTKELLRRLERAQPLLHVMITLTPELALETARDIDERRSRGDRLPLDGMPVVVKDNVDVAGVPTTVGSELFRHRVATADAEVVRRLHAGGAVILGKANMHELAFGATSANESFGNVVNPLAPDRIPGGSSGGSGAAVAADLCVAAIGTDTGGSIRLPASLCGVSGLRPTFGAVSNRGVQPVCPSLDTVGPLARSVDTVRDVLTAISSYDANDPTSCISALERDVGDGAAGLRVGVVEVLFEQSDHVVAERVWDVVETLRAAGATISQVCLPGWEAAAEACGNLIRADALALYRDALKTHPELLEEGTRRRLQVAAGFTPVHVDDLRRDRARWAQTLDDALAELDVLLFPTIGIEAPFTEGAESVGTTAAVVPYAFVTAFAHVPSLTIPCGSTPSGAPVGAQLSTRRFRDSTVLRAASAVQAKTDWHLHRAA